MHPSLLQIAFALFLLMDPLGNICLFLSLLRHLPEKRKRMVILRELSIALLLILACYFVGDFALDLIQINPHTLLIAGGIILFLISLQMIFPEPLREKKEDLPSVKEPFIVPLAIPLVAGPAVLAAVMLYSQEASDCWTVPLAILLAWSCTTLILLGGSFLQRVLGDKCLVALEKLMGLLLTLLSVQMFLQGLSLYLGTL